MSCCGEGKLGKAIHGAAGVVKAAGHFVGINGVPGDVIDRRVNECKNCEHGGPRFFCGACGCIIGAKIRVKGEMCPIGKWGPVDAS